MSVYTEYEIHEKQEATGNWIHDETRPTKEAAIDYAKSVTHKRAAVQVIKQTREMVANYNG